MLRSGWACSLFAVCALTALGAPASARADFVASASDPSGDASDPSPGRDITSIGLAYDRKEGSLSGFVRLRGSPEETPSLMTLFAGVRTANGCVGVPAGGFGAGTEEYDARWLKLNATGQTVARGDADKTGFDSPLQRFEVSEPALRGGAWDCAVATLSEPGNAAIVYDTTGAIPLVGQPEISVRVRTRDQFRRNRSHTLKFRVSNPGDGPARRVNLRLGRARGLSLSPHVRSLGTIGAGKRKVVRVKLRFSDRARSLTELAVKASSGRLVAKGTLDLNVRTPQPRGGGGGGGGGDGGFTPKTCTRYSPDPFGDTGGSLILVPC